MTHGRGPFEVLLEPYGMGFDTASEDCLEEYAATPEIVRNLMCALDCHTMVCNGGFFGYFEPSSGLLAPEAATGFVALDMSKTAACVRRAILVLGNPFPRDFDERWAALGCGPWSGESSWESGMSAQEAMAKAAKDGMFDQLEAVRASFRPIEDEFFELVENENGGFQAAANAYALKARQQERG